MKESFRLALKALESVPDSVRYEELQLLWLYETLRRLDWNKTQAAIKLGIALRTVRNNVKYIEGLGLKVPIYKRP